MTFWTRGSIAEGSRKDRSRNVRAERKTQDVRVRCCVRCSQLNAFAPFVRICSRSLFEERCVCVVVRSRVRVHVRVGVIFLSCQIGILLLGLSLTSPCHCRFLQENRKIDLILYSDQLKMDLICFPAWAWPWPGPWPK